MLMKKVNLLLLMMFLLVGGAHLRAQDSGSTQWYIDFSQGELPFGTTTDGNIYFYAVRDSKLLSDICELLISKVLPAIAVIELSQRKCCRLIICCNGKSLILGNAIIHSSGA